ncbi:ClC family H(+)/Cl(-) exchange transporter [Sporolactobacillus inulinus]|uniref:ATP synthase F0 subunit A n=1 Tax=Sporolactobacillus inulinus CASD TaxID=1069536 RepID=A0A0U1QNA8_9BACL|nr:ClC family H(+)/Cl(-) exchange transporter [Sporolactobacillus inulinus]KLI02252.1 ATP synthase F0 subunit A [Sporolactobacillus inulinus CASD]GEB78424.1 ATP synthase F0 subunit A [Sporolactobacillus inulinus]
MRRNKEKSAFDATRLLFILKGLVVGILTGFVVSLFRILIEFSLHLWTKLYQFIPDHPWTVFVAIFISSLLALLIGIIARSQPNIMGSGIPQVEGQLAGDLEMNWWQILWRKFITGVLGIGAGLFLGREGPSIQLGAAVGQGIAQGLKSTGISRRVLIASGSAAGLSAAFNAPIAGTLFVLEEVYHNFSPFVWMASLAGAIGSDFVSSNFFGLVPVLHISYSRSFPLYLYWHLILLGVVLGLFGFLYQKVLLKMPQWYERFIKLHRYFHGLVPFLLVIPIGIMWPHTLGGGNTIILGMGNVTPGLTILLGLFVLRFIFSMISYGSGLPGGIFLPILSLGAILGAIYGTVMSDLGLLPNIYIMNLIIISMAGYFAGIGKAPFTAIILITEMVGSLEHLMPLALVSLIAYLVVDLLGGAPIYASLLARLNLGKKLNELSGRNDHLEIPVFLGSDLDEQQVRDVNWPNHSLLISIHRGEHEIIPHGDTMIRSGDTLILLIDHNEMSVVRKIILKMSRSQMT